MVDELYLSPSVKRMLWQSLRIVDEITGIMGNNPKKIFIEMARGEEEKKDRKNSRKKNILEFYKKGKVDFIKEIGEDRYNYLVSEIEREEEPKFRWDNLYLYYTQLGRCMYSLEPIELSDLASKNIYDQDHIYPKSKIYDDSIENRVLVKKNLNHEKGNMYPIPEKVLNKNCYSYWKILHDKKLIGDKKYARLIRNTAFNDDELLQFIERQIVETRQATKETANLLKTICKNSEIVYSKASNVSRFRQEFDILKCRTVNDLHHMHDAYLNIVVGNVYNTKFTKNPRNFIKDKEENKSYNLENMFKYDVKRGNYIAWIADNHKGSIKDATIKRIKKEIQGTNYRFTRMSYIGKGELYNQNLKRKGNGQFPQKENSKKFDINKYGGYNKAGSAYFALVESDGKKEREKTLETIPIIVNNKVKNGEKDAIYNYLTKNLELKNPEILVNKIKINALIKLDGFFYNITGKTNDYYLIAPAVQLILDKKDEKTIIKLEKFLSRKLKDKNAKVLKSDGIESKDILSLYDNLSDKLNNSIFKYRIKNLSEVITSGRDLFINLKKEDQILVLKEMLLLFQNINNGVDLGLIGNVNKKTKKPIKASGKTLLSKKINYNEFKLINQSITGLFENELDLIKI